MRWLSLGTTSVQILQTGNRPELDSAIPAKSFASAITNSLTGCRDFHSKFRFVAYDTKHRTLSINSSIVSADNKSAKETIMEENTTPWRDGKKTKSEIMLMIGRNRELWTRISNWENLACRSEKWKRSEIFEDFEKNDEAENITWLEKREKGGNVANVIVMVMMILAQPRPNQNCKLAAARSAMKKGKANFSSGQRGKWWKPGFRAGKMTVIHRTNLACPRGDFNFLRGQFGTRKVANTPNEVRFSGCMYDS